MIEKKYNRLPWDVQFLLLCQNKPCRFNLAYPCNTAIPIPPTSPISRVHAMTPIQLFDTRSSTYTYVLFDESTREALIIDPVDEQIERDLGVLRQYGLKLLWTVETHAHADHITSAGQLAELAGPEPLRPRAAAFSLRPFSLNTVTPCLLARKPCWPCTRRGTLRAA
jgi:glyoxylase-like metal-dependent hydrolase (beta-lactamase superfamily II)